MASWYSGEFLLYRIPNVSTSLNTREEKCKSVKVIIRIMITIIILIYANNTTNNKIIWFGNK